MRRRPPNQIHRRLRQLTLGADGLIHPRKDYYERKPFRFYFVSRVVGYKMLPDNNH